VGKVERLESAGASREKVRPGTDREAGLGGLTEYSVDVPCESDTRRSCASMRPRHTVHPEHKKAPEGASL